MKIHEYQAKEILKKYGVPVPIGYVAYTVGEAVEAARQLPTEIAVVKAQIHAGGRGKGGGVKIARSPEDVGTLAQHMLGMTLVTHQTGPEGRKVSRLLIEQGVDILKEYYAGIVLDRASAKNVVMVSTEGGMEIEKVAEESPEKDREGVRRSSYRLPRFRGARACVCPWTFRRGIQAMRGFPKSAIPRV
jgi:succinyl-CoA synthetase beta subunit